VFSLWSERSAMKSDTCVCDRGTKNHREQRRTRRREQHGSIEAVRRRQLVSQSARPLGVCARRRSPKDVFGSESAPSTLLSMHACRCAQRRRRRKTDVFSVVRPVGLEERAHLSGTNLTLFFFFFLFLLGHNSSHLFLHFPPSCNPSSLLAFAPSRLL